MASSLHLLLSIWLIPLLATAHAETVTPESDNHVVRIFPVRASQGVAVDKKHFYAISNMRISKHDKITGDRISEWEADPKVDAQSHFKHMNSGTVINEKLYCAHSRFPIDPNANTVEIFDISGEAPEHESTIRMPRKHGSLTWIDQHEDGSFWMCYAVYGKPANRKTKLVAYAFENGKFTEKSERFFPDEAIAIWETMSCSGGSWGPGGNLYVTGHDKPVASVVRISNTGALHHLRTIPLPGISGQAIAWDRSAAQPALWGIVKNKHVARVELPMKR